MTYGKACEIAAAPWEYTIEECEMALERIRAKKGRLTAADNRDIENLLFEIL